MMMALVSEWMNSSKGLVYLPFSEAALLESSSTFMVLVWLWFGQVCFGFSFFLSFFKQHFGKDREVTAKLWFSLLRSIVAFRMLFIYTRTCNWSSHSWPVKMGSNCLLSSSMMVRQQQLSSSDVTWIRQHFYGHFMCHPVKFFLDFIFKFYTCRQQQCQLTFVDSWICVDLF